MYQAIVENPTLAAELGFTQSDVGALANGSNTRRLDLASSRGAWYPIQLVDEEEHANTAHTGGRTIWGDGSEFR
ncbi:HNH endonuclease [Metabacillus litoralis]|uniref:HNH endonuclease n=1 Tax=Metabacillus litoralis TaxID=152268 RepID=UPI001CFC4ED4|nr:HNH endonuclease [Metabacillus litoralis]